MPLMTADDIQQVKHLFDSALLRFGVSATVQEVAESDVCLLTVSFDLWNRHYVGDFILSDQGLRTAGTCFFWINAEIHVWQWIAMALSASVDDLNKQMKNSRTAIKVSRWQSA